MKEKLLFLILTILCSQGMLFADDGSSGTDTNNTTVLRKQLPNKNRPNSLIPEEISCYYINGILEFEIPEGIPEGTVSVTGNNSGIISKISYLNPSIEINLSSGIYYISYTTNEGDSYGGNIIID